MDTEDAKEILDGGKTNDLRKAGTLIKDPNVVLNLFVNGNEFHTKFGDFNPDTSDLDYLVHRAKGVTLSEQDEFYKENEVEVEIYTLDDNNEVNTSRWTASEDGWEEN